MKKKILKDIMKDVTSENFHAEIEDDMKEWMELPNEFDNTEWIWDSKPSEEECIEETKELVDIVGNEKLEFTHSADEIREMNRRRDSKINLFEYKGYTGSIEYSESDKVYFWQGFIYQ